MAIYERPELPEGVKPVSLVPDGAKQELDPKTRVLIVNRGTQAYRDKFDGRDYTVPPRAVAEVEFEVADHFRNRSVVPGSRDPISGKQDRFIAILGIDRPERCAMLTADEQVKADTAVEAIDPEAVDAPGRRQVVSTQAARSRTAGGNRNRKQSAESNDGTEQLEVNDVLAPVSGGDAMKQIARDSAEKAALTE
jgi:hypothetical protein